ncbi:hypothetical protein AB4Y45_45190 [Paraburkholderia sp. EG287A]
MKRRIDLHSEVYGRPYWRATRHLDKSLFELIDSAGGKILKRL